MTDVRAAWIGTCMFWAWAWLIGSLVWVPFTFGLSLLGLLLAGGSIWAIWIPIGVPQSAIPSVPAYPPLPPGQYGPPPWTGRH